MAGIEEYSGTAEQLKRAFNRLAGRSMEQDPVIENPIDYSKIGKTRIDYNIDPVTPSVSGQTAILTKDDCSRLAVIHENLAKTQTVHPVIDDLRFVVGLLQRATNEEQYLRQKIDQLIKVLLGKNIEKHSFGRDPLMY